MKVVVLAGPESSGKSWLAGELQARFGGLLVAEYVRHFIDWHQRDTCLADIPEIARGQLAWEDAARAQQPALLILDTHLLSNILWSQTLFGDCPTWLEPALLARQYDLHLLLSPDGVSWTDDGQRCQPELDERRAFFAASLGWLTEHQQAVRILDGDWQQRHQQAMAAVEQLLMD
ncbi:AAA family ATPase [Pseudomonas gingeri]|uniref:AAA family ATPase n=1 Tax=Pseudomonas gingeri TaxID=117681 RepID=UPI0015A427C5|nr:AAA family ATPase [Pseudomonas gingeri]NWD05151.1 AAA family ATPase [Pseudomonas gingeri]NWE36437.1 AAA family ATPase [Pseudomonas gingeri]NWE57098.1 AAA family ATPase [Pseudomonas gingeri]NWF00671.1 AAA family ATPase [Pseudomonas gingeri]